MTSIIKKNWGKKIDPFGVTQGYQASESEHRLKNELVISAADTDITAGMVLAVSTTVFDSDTNLMTDAIKATAAHAEAAPIVIALEDIPHGSWGRFASRANEIQALNDSGGSLSAGAFVGADSTANKAGVIATATGHKHVAVIQTGGADGELITLTGFNGAEGLGQNHA